VAEELNFEKETGEQREESYPIAEAAIDVHSRLKLPLDRKPLPEHGSRCSSGDQRCVGCR